jgi:hypothetical protein
LLTVHVVEVADGVVVEPGVVVEAPEGAVVEVVALAGDVEEVVVDEDFFGGFVEWDADLVPPEHPTRATAQVRQERRMRTPRPNGPMKLRC